MNEPGLEAFTARHYDPRAADYVASAVHRAGADLDQLEVLLRGRRLRRVLDLGCGGGHVSYLAARHADEVVACDIAPAMLEIVSAEARERGLSNISVREAAAHALPFEAGAFDAVLCRFSAHHWRDLEAGLREARRVLGPSGLAVFIDTVSPGDALLDSHLQAVELLRDPSHVRNYSLGEWTAALARAQFAVGGVTCRRLRMEFASWTARTRTPEMHAAVILSVQNAAPPGVRAGFEIAQDGSFMLDSMTVTAMPA